VTDCDHDLRVIVITMLCVIVIVRRDASVTQRAYHGLHVITMFARDRDRDREAGCLSHPEGMAGR